MSRMETKATKKKIMNKGMFNRILALMYRRVENYDCESIPDFVEHMLSLNKVICYRCRNPIEAGSQYNAATSGRRIRKYYHSKCWENLFQ